MANNFFAKYERKLDSQFPLFFKRAMELSGLADEKSFSLLSHEFLPEVYEELSAQIIRFAKSVDKSPNDVNREANLHINQRCYSSVDDYKLPVKFRVILTEILNECKNNVKTHRSQSASCSPNQGTSTSKRMRQEDDEFILGDISQEQLNLVPKFLQLIIKNALANKPGFKGNRYEDIIKDIGGLLLCRNGPKQYEIFQLNMSLPEISTIRDYIDSNSINLQEGVLYIDELKNYLVRNCYALEVGVFEDGTKIVEEAEYDIKNNTIVGLSMPLNTVTGMPLPSIKAWSASTIKESLKNYDKSTVVQVICAKPNDLSAKSFVIGFFGTSNKFTGQNVISRIIHIQQELSLRGIKMLVYGTDGDSRCIMAQKYLSNYGALYDFCGMKLAGPIQSQYIFSQDPLHLVKKMKNVLFDFGTDLKLGNYFASLGFLLILNKKFSSEVTGLNQSDLDFKDRMNYKNIEKIVSDKVFDLLLEIPGSSGMIAYLKIIKKLLVSFCYPDTNSKDRVRNAIYCAEFLRLWKQDLLNKNEKNVSNYFVTQNIFDGVELNLIMLLSLVVNSKERNIHKLSSQVCENFFRLLRSFTTIESTVVNFTLKGLVSRMQKILFVENVTYKLKDFVQFEKSAKQGSLNNLSEQPLSFEEIQQAILAGRIEAKREANFLGMCEEVSNYQAIIKPIKTIHRVNSHEQTEEEDDETQNDFLGISNALAQNVEELEVVFNGNEFSNIRTNDGSLMLQTGDVSAISKSKFIKWLQSDKKKVSSDVKHRYINQRTLQIHPLASSSSTLDLWRNETISRGDHIIISERQDLYFGRVLNFRFYKEKTKGKRTFYEDIVHIEYHDLKKIGVLIHPIYKVVNYHKVEVRNFDSYICIENYKFHAKENVDFTKNSNKNVIKSVLKKN